VRRQRAEAGPEINAEGDAVTDTKRERRPDRLYWAEDWSRGTVPSYTVYEPEGDRDTGLLDASGNKIMVRRQPIGFDLTARKR
jgi:hypothetical protein